MNKSKREESNTKTLIRKVSMELMSQKPFEDVTIREICSQAGVPIGSFYYFYKNKEELIIEKITKLDEIIANEVEKLYVPGESSNNILTFTRIYSVYMEDEGFDCVKQFIRASIQNKDDIFIMRKKKTYKTLRRIILDGQDRSLLTNRIGAEELARMIMIIIDGYSYDWVKSEGRYPLVSTTMSAIEFWMKLIIN